jgi:hypothetical protein
MRKKFYSPDPKKTLDPCSLVNVNPIKTKKPMKFLFKDSESKIGNISLEEAVPFKKQKTRAVNNQHIITVGQMNETITISNPLELKLSKEKSYDSPNQNKILSNTMRMDKLNKVVCLWKVKV